MNHSFTWQGRHDGDGEEHRRIHHVVNTTQHASFALIGFGSDEGVKRNKGRLGAADAPDMIRAQLANLPVHQSVSIVDIGTAGHAHALAGIPLESISPLSLLIIL